MAIAFDHVNQIRRKIGELVGIWGDLELLKIEYQKLDLGNVLTDDDFANSDITKQEFVDGIAATLAVMAALDTNGTNLFKVSDGGHR